MARQNRTAAPAADEQVAAPEGTEEQVTPTPTEAEGTESTEAPATEGEGTEAEVSLEPFQAVVNEQVATRDDSTGVMSTEALGKITDAYRSLEGQKPKNAARTWVEEQMLEAVGELNVQLARALGDAKKALVAGGTTKTSTPKAPADPTEAFVQRVAGLRLAETLIERGDNVAEDADERITKLVESLGEQVTAYKTWLDTEVAEGETKPDAPEVSPVVRNAFKLATGKASGGGRKAGGSGPRGDIGKHVTQAFADVESGKELKVSEIAKFKSTEYPNGDASQGAISARLFAAGGCTIEGITVLEKDDNGPRRARKN